MTRRLLVVGERREPSPGELPWEPEHLASDWLRFQWLVRSRVDGAFVLGLGRRKLAAVGLDFAGGRVDSMNLLPPGGKGSWDAASAAAVAGELRTRLFAAWCTPEELAEHGVAGLDWGRASWQRHTWRYSGVVLCGRRVAEAMGHGELGFWASDGGVLLVPHPSGLSREWNGLDLGAALSRVERWVEGLPPC